jgi:hypothetical protein
MAIAKKRTAKRAEVTASSSRGEHMSAKEASLRSLKLEAAESHEANQDAFSSAISKREKIALLAFGYWVQRGCQGGSAEEDWFRAEREMVSAPSSVHTVN